jgi:hypothetical protein
MKFGVVETTKTVRDEQGRKAKIPALAVVLCDDSERALLRVRLGHATTFRRYSAALATIGAAQTASVLSDVAATLEGGFKAVIAKARSTGLAQRYALPELPEKVAPRGKRSVLTVQL